MKKIFFTFCLVCQFINTSVSADITKFLDPDDEVEIYYDFEEGMQKVNIKVLDRVLN